MSLTTTSQLQVIAYPECFSWLVTNLISNYTRSFKYHRIFILFVLQHEPWLLFEIKLICSTHTTFVSSCYPVLLDFSANFLGFFGRPRSCYPKVLSLLLYCYIGNNYFMQVYNHAHLILFLYIFFCFIRYSVDWNSGFVCGLVGRLRIEQQINLVFNSQFNHTIVLCRPHELLTDHRSSIIYLCGLQIFSLEE